MTPREALDVLLGLDVSVARAFSGAQFDASYAHPTIAGRGGWIVPILRWDALGLSASSTCPALETLAGCVVVSVEDAAMLSSCVSEDMSGAPPEYRASLRRFRAAIAEAEEAMR